VGNGWPSVSWPVRAGIPSRAVVHLWRQFADWSGDYRLFSRINGRAGALWAHRWGILELTPPTDPLVVAMDDTLLRKTGTRFPAWVTGGIRCRRPFRSLRSGQRFLQVSGLLPAGEVPAAAGPFPCVSSMFRPYPSQEVGRRRREEDLSPTSEDRESQYRGAGLLHQLRAELDQRHGACTRRLIAGADRPLRLVVIAPVGYRLRKNSRLLYRQPAYLICTDVNLPLALVLQYYIWRWGVEVNHRDENRSSAWVKPSPRPALRRSPTGLRRGRLRRMLLAAARAYGWMPTAARCRSPNGRPTSRGREYQPGTDSRITK